MWCTTHSTCKILHVIRFVIPLPRYHGPFKDLPYFSKVRLGVDHKPGRTPGRTWGGGNSWLGATSFAGLQQGPSHYNDTFTIYYVFTSTSAQFSMCGKHHSHSEDKTFRHRRLTSDPASVTVPNRLLVVKPNSFSTSSTQMRRTSESCVLSLSSAAG